LDLLRHSISSQPAFSAYLEYHYWQEHITNNEWPELMISQRDGYHHGVHSWIYTIDRGLNLNGPTNKAWCDALSGGTGALAVRTVRTAQAQGGELQQLRRCKNITVTMPRDDAAAFQNLLAWDDDYAEQYDYTRRRAFAALILGIAVIETAKQATTPRCTSIFNETFSASGTTSRQRMGISL
jgi:hypothetical protein